MILDTIVLYKRELVMKERKTLPLSILLAEIEHLEDPRNFKKAIEKNTLSIIGEIKKASPSKGIIKEDFSPKDLAKTYELCNVDAISVLTEDKFFLGSNDYLKIVKKETSKPVLRKDFIIDEYQIYQSRYLGADAILIIAALHDCHSIHQLLQTTYSLGLSAIVEVHTEKELENATCAGAEIIGINNRNLHTFETSLATTERLISKVPKGCVVVSESGIHNREDMLSLQQMGVHGVLIGESIMRSDNICEKIRELRGEEHWLK